MNRYTYALITEIGYHLEEEHALSPDTIIAELFTDEEDESGGGLDEADWMEIMMQLERLYGISIPPEWAEQYDMTLDQLSQKMLALTELPASHYDDFLDAHMQLLESWQTFKEKAAEESVSDEQLTIYEQEFQQATEDAYETIASLFEDIEE